MLIQRVVIQGFKTFAKRTEFIFDPGITAVVGPNGSGKSNIVDAVRWCLGEQSFSLLRSKKTSDIIFSGSDKRARLGMAQVSLVLDNSGGEIPIDFSEVEITRRAYRDGDNEYLVNGQKVRLADVTQLLAQTGLGKRTYAVIGQGLIDRVLSLAPEERRSLFEEAAGISGYQAKREAALRRLEATQSNLVRVRDITAELAPRLGYLKRQADRARERAQMATDLRGLLREWYGYKWHKALTDVENYHADARILKNGMDDRQVTLDAVAARIEGMRLRQVELRGLLNEHHRAASGLHHEAERVSRDLAVASERARQAQERHAEIQRELSPLRVEHASLVEREAALRVAVAEAEGALAQERRALDATNQALAEQRRAQAQTQHTVDDARAALARAQASLADAQSRLRQLEERGEALAAARARHSEAVQAAHKQAAASHAQLQAAETTHAEMEARAATIAMALASAQQRRDAQRTQLEAAESRRRDADRDADRLQTRFDLLRRLSNEGAGMHSGVRAVVQAKLPGIRGVVASLLHVPPDLDKAVETALGGALQNLVAESWADAEHAIGWLKQQQRGRATFLPLDRLNVLPAIPAPKMEGILGNGAELIACAAGVEAARDQLLNRLWVARDLPTARRALDQVRGGARPTVVTLGGEIVRPGGAVTGGSDNHRGDESSVLQRERELRELPHQVAEAQDAARASSEACRALAAEVASAAAAVDEQARAQSELARQERTQQSALAELRRASDRAQQQSAYVAQQATEFTQQATTLHEQRAALEETLPALARARGEAELNLTTAQNAHVAGDGAQLLHALADQRAAEALAQGTLNSRRALVEQQTRNIAQVAAQIRSKEERSTQLQREGAETARWLAALTAQEQTLNAQLAAVQQEITPHESELATLERAQIAAESEERALQQLQRRDETTWSHAQIALQRSQDGVAQLQTDIARDLGLVAYEESSEFGVQQPLPMEAYVEALPLRETLADGLEEEVVALRTRLARLSNVNHEAPREYDEASERYSHLTTQADDLESAAADLYKIIRNLDEMMQSELSRTFAAVAKHFQIEFQKLFNGGTGELVLTDPANIAETGIEIIARPPGKRPQSLALLSGGERALAACALIFAILRVSPTPFCVLDEVDAALDEANVDRFRLAVQDLSDAMQFIIVTHNRRTLEGANTIYGITMGNDGVSKAISLRLEGEHVVHNLAGAGNGASNSAGNAHGAVVTKNGAPLLEDAPSARDVDDAIAELDELVQM